MNRTNPRSLLDPRALLTSAALTTSLLLTGGGCGAIGEGPQGPNAPEKDDTNALPDDDAGGGNGGTANGGAANGGATGGNVLPPEPCGEVALAAKAVLNTNCASCHTAGAQAKGGFANVLDAPALVASGKIVPGKPDDSPLYGRMTSTGSPMPPAGVQDPRPSAADLVTIRDWIICDAPDWDAPAGGGGAAAYMSINERLTLMRSDLRNPRVNAADRVDIRYIDFASLSNGGYSAAQVEEFREGASLVLNSLSYSTLARSLKPVEGSNGLLYRINLRDYGWQAADWDLIVEDYPYIVEYNDDSEKFPFEEQFARELRDLTRTTAPYIQADWLIAHASQPPLYYDVLGFSGKNLNQIAAEVGVDIDANIRRGQIARSAFTFSGVSEQNRMIEQHDIPGQPGSFWLSYDFLTNIANENLQVNPLSREEFLALDPNSPLGFQEAGGEAIFHLPNGLLAYLIMDAQGNLLDEVPNDVATDPNSKTREVIGAVSCMGCHANGIIRKDDEIRNLYDTGGQSSDGLAAEAVLRVYPPVAEMTELVSEDNDVYTRARSLAGINKLGELSMSKMVNGHERSLNVNQVAAVLGVTPEQLKGALNNLVGDVAVFNGLKTGGTVSRELFEANIKDLVERVLALGRALDTPAVNNN